MWCKHASSYTVDLDATALRRAGRRWKIEQIQVGVGREKFTLTFTMCFLKARITSVTMGFLWNPSITLLVGARTGKEAKVCCDPLKRYEEKQKIHLRNSNKAKVAASLSENVW